MRFQNTTDSLLTEVEHMGREMADHDMMYKDGLPFYSDTLRFTPEHVWHVNDREYLPGRFLRGWRKRRLMELLRLHSIAGLRVLDVGCGTGDLAVFVAMHGAQVCGIDISTEGIRVANKIAEANDLAGACTFLVGSAAVLPYPDEVFDVVILNASLHHIIKYSGARDELLRVLRHGGRMVFADGLRDNPFYRLPRALYHRLTGRRGHGDVDVQYSDILLWGRGFREHYIETFCLFLGAKELFAKQRGNGVAVRSAMLALKIMDDVTLRAAPSLGRYCSEIVGCFTK